MLSYQLTQSFVYCLSVIFIMLTLVCVGRRCLLSKTQKGVKMFLCLGEHGAFLHVEFI